VLAKMARVGGVDCFESEKPFIGIGRSISEISPCASEAPLHEVTEESITEDCGEVCERVVNEDEDEECGGYKIRSQVDPTDEEGSAGVTSPPTACMGKGDNWDSETGSETTIAGTTVISSPLCKVIPLPSVD
jgi:hypothetical protein